MNETIILYSTGCPKCEVLKKKLAEKNIEFTTNESAKEMVALGIENVPVLRVGDKLMNFSEAIKWINR